MKKQSRQLYLLAGLWCSLSAAFLAAGSLLPVTHAVVQQSPALLYRVALNEEFHTPMETTPQTSGKSIVADLEGMQLSLYEGVSMIKTFPILSRGREGTFWETPTGKYLVQMKELRHFSSIGGVWMPYSMQFYGNFFIHGWPVNPDGSDVPQGYSGGCIRLATDDARVVYEFADAGTRVLVTGVGANNGFGTSSRYYLHGEGMPPTITAEEFIAADIDNGAVLWERNANRARPMEELVALPAALTALETVNQYKVVRMSELLLGTALLRKHSIGADDEMPAGVLIYPLLFGANDTAANVFAREHGTTRFVAYMEEKAAAIGMEHTDFGGVLAEETSTTTAHDMLTLLRYVNASKHFLIDATNAHDRVLTDKDGKSRYSWENKNPWIVSGDAAYQGGIAAVRAGGGGSAMLLFAVPVSEFANRTIGIVIFDSKDLTGDVERIRTFIAEHYRFGIERADMRFVPEPNEPTPTFLQKMKALLDLENLLRDDVAYERDLS